MSDLHISDAEAAALLPLPSSDANKYTRGTLHVIGGSARYPGAAALAARASQRMGTGYTQVWCAPESIATVRAQGSSLVVRAWDAQELDQALRKAKCGEGHPSAVLIGCGFDGKSLHELQLLRIVLAHAVPAVIDAGALSGLAHLVAREGLDFLHARAAAEDCAAEDCAARAAAEDCAARAAAEGGAAEDAAAEDYGARAAAEDGAVEGGASLVLTPHAGEANRLMNALNEEYVKVWKGEHLDACDEAGRNDGCESRDTTCKGNIERMALSGRRNDGCESRDAIPFSTARLLSDAYAATVVLKGPQTVIARGDGTYLMSRGTAALAKAGTGDVLAGIIGSLLCQGVAPEKAGYLGALLHARAGWHAAQDLTSVCVIPEDVVAYLPHAIRECLAARASA